MAEYDFLAPTLKNALAKRNKSIKDKLNPLAAAIAPSASVPVPKAPSLAEAMADSSAPSEFKKAIGGEKEKRVKDMTFAEIATTGAKAAQEFATDKLALAMEKSPAVTKGVNVAATAIGSVVDGATAVKNIKTRADERAEELLDLSEEVKAGRKSQSDLVKAYAATIGESLVKGGGDILSTAINLTPAGAGMNALMQGGLEAIGQKENYDEAVQGVDKIFIGIGKKMGLDDKQAEQFGTTVSSAIQTGAGFLGFAKGASKMSRSNTPMQNLKYAATDVGYNSVPAIVGSTYNAVTGTQSGEEKVKSVLGTAITAGAINAIASEPTAIGRSIIANKRGAVGNLEPMKVGDEPEIKDNEQLSREQMLEEAKADAEIAKGTVRDVYAGRTVQQLKRAGLDDKRIVAQLTKEGRMAEVVEMTKGTKKAKKEEPVAERKNVEPEVPKAPKKEIMSPLYAPKKNPETVAKQPEPVATKTEEVPQMKDVFDEPVAQKEEVATETPTTVTETMKTETEFNTNKEAWAAKRAQEEAVRQQAVAEKRMTAIEAAKQRKEVNALARKQDSELRKAELEQAKADKATAKAKWHEDRAKKEAERVTAKQEVVTEEPVAVVPEKAIVEEPIATVVEEPVVKPQDEVGLAIDEALANATPEKPVDVFAIAEQADKRKKAKSKGKKVKEGEVGLIDALKVKDVPASNIELRTAQKGVGSSMIAQAGKKISEAVKTSKGALNGVAVTINGFTDGLGNTIDAIKSATYANVKNSANKQYMSVMRANAEKVKDQVSSAADALRGNEENVFIGIDPEVGTKEAVKTLKMDAIREPKDGDTTARDYDYLMSAYTMAERNGTLDAFANVVGPENFKALSNNFNENRAIFQTMTKEIGDSLIERDLINTDSPDAYDRKYVSEDRYDAYSEQVENRNRSIEEKDDAIRGEVDPMTVRQNKMKDPNLEKVEKMAASQLKKSDDMWYLHSQGIFNRGADYVDKTATLIGNDDAIRMANAAYDTHDVGTYYASQRDTVKPRSDYDYMVQKILGLDVQPRVGVKFIDDSRRVGSRGMSIGAITDVLSMIKSYATTTGRALWLEPFVALKTRTLPKIKFSNYKKVNDAIENLGIVDGFDHRDATQKTIDWLGKTFGGSQYDHLTKLRMAYQYMQYTVREKFGTVPKDETEVIRMFNDAVAQMPNAERISRIREIKNVVNRISDISQGSQSGNKWFNIPEIRSLKSFIINETTNKLNDVPELVDNLVNSARRGDRSSSIMEDAYLRAGTYMVPYVIVPMMVKGVLQAVFQEEFDTEGLTEEEKKDKEGALDKMVTYISGNDVSSMFTSMIPSSAPLRLAISNLVDLSQKSAAAKNGNWDEFFKEDDAIGAFRMLARAVNDDVTTADGTYKYGKESGDIRTMLLGEPTKFVNQYFIDKAKEITDEQKTAQQRAIDMINLTDNFKLGLAKVIGVWKTERDIKKMNDVLDAYEELPYGLSDIDAIRTILTDAGLDKEHIDYATARDMVLDEEKSEMSSIKKIRKLLDGYGYNRNAQNDTADFKKFMERIKSDDKNKFTEIMKNLFAATYEDARTGKVEGLGADYVPVTADYVLANRYDMVPAATTQLSKAVSDAINLGGDLTKLNQLVGSAKRMPGLWNSVRDSLAETVMSAFTSSNPTKGNVKDYPELKQLLIDAASRRAATLREFADSQKGGAPISVTDTSSESTGIGIPTAGGIRSKDTPILDLNKILGRAKESRMQFATPSLSGADKLAKLFDMTKGIRASK